MRKNTITKNLHFICKLPIKLCFTYVSKTYKLLAHEVQLRGYVGALFPRLL